MFPQLFSAAANRVTSLMHTHTFTHKIALPTLLFTSTNVDLYTVKQPPASLAV